MSTLDKRALVAQIVAELNRELTVLTEAAQATREGATHEEARPENDKDTRAIEASYLAGAQAERVRDLRGVVAAFESLVLRSFVGGEPIAAGALVTVECDGTRALYFVAPQGGGVRTRVGTTEVLVITPRSPVGKALLGRVEGDVVEVETQRTLRDYEIVSVE